MIRSILGSKIFICLLLFFLLAAGSLVYLYKTDEGVANEFRQMRQPMPNLFYVGVDVSATIDSTTLDYLKNGIIERLSQFIGQSTVSYDIETFGNPGCGKTSVRKIVSAKSPDDETEFGWKVEKKIKSIRSTKGKARSGIPSTTPLYYLLKKELDKKPGGRVIIFSDLMNDDSDCVRQYPFPEKVIEKFGKNRDGQLIFIYPTPPLTSNRELNRRIMKRQREFIEKMEKMRSEGKVRAFFYHIPDDPQKRADFIRKRLSNSIPATTFEVVVERASKMVDTIVSAVRG